MKTQPSLEQQLRAIPEKSRSELSADYEKLYQQKPPRQISRHLLELAVAYRIQEELVGRLRHNIRRALMAGEVVVSTLATGSAGTVLVREWKGRHYTVTVQTKGVTYEGERYGSLSEVARLITGQRWSGPAFFGLKEKNLGR